MRSIRVNLFAAAIVFLASGLSLKISAQESTAPSIQIGSAAQTNLPTLTKVEEVRRLSPEEADRHYPVKLQGVVLDYSAQTPHPLFVSDNTGSIFVRMADDRPLSQGQVVEITGVSGAGRFAPVVIPTSLQIVGMAELPPPQDILFQKIASGTEDSQWVRLSGIVRSITFQNLQGKPKRPIFTIATEDGGRLNVLINDYHGEPLQSLVDTEVEATGIAESIYNGKRQLINVRLLVPTMKFIKVRREAPQDVLLSPPRPIDSLRQFSPNEPSGHRVKVQGIVTLQQPGECIFIRDKTGSIRIETMQTNPVSPGDRVDALGFPAVYGYTPVMEDAVFHKIGMQLLPQPLKLTAKDLRWHNHEADLVSVEGQLLDQFRTPDQLILILQEGDILFRAQLAQPQAAGVNLRNGAQLQITGVCLTQVENYPLPQTFQIVLRSPADLIVLRTPSWWTPQRLQWVLCILTGVLLGAGIWVGTLRRQVRIQTEAIGNKIEREAVLHERMRIAREFHDSLEQELAGVKMQLELTAATVAHAPETAAASLQMAKNMISHSQAEARRSVWELRSQILENSTLPSALSATVHSVESKTPIEVNISGTEYSLSMRVESNLLRIAQEAITNSIKHARPRRISVSLAYEANGTRLKISDNGCGFSVEEAPDGQTGHFGLLGMRERVNKISGSLQITSALGKGTCVEVFVPQLNGSNKEKYEKENSSSDCG
jgi:signal transduction histidine kinase